ncbi:hypothetical protein O9929_13495 [Vibrio lentus]|nr:hypothetical protein [Vibrio lentus]
MVSQNKLRFGFTQTNPVVWNEASDMAGEAAEYYMKGTNDWMSVKYL